MTFSALGQGTVWMANRVEGRVDAPIFTSTRLPDQPGRGTWVAQLQVKAGTNRSFIAVGDPVPVNVVATAGGSSPAAYFSGGAVVIPGVRPGESIQAKVTAWNLRLGQTFAAAMAAGVGGLGESDVLTLLAGGGGAPAALLTGLRSFSIGQLASGFPPLENPPTGPLPGSLPVVQRGRFDDLFYPYELTSRGATLGELTVLAQEEAGMDILDVSVPAHPRRLSWWRGSDVRFVVLRSSLAVVVGWSNIVTTVDLSIPERPRTLGTTGPDPRLGGLTPTMAAVGNDTLLAVSRQDRGVDLFSVADPVRPLHVSIVYLKPAPVLALEGTLLLTGHGDELALFDVSQPVAPREAARWFTASAGQVRALALNGGLACVLTTTGELQLWDSRVVPPRLTGTSSLGADTTQLLASGRYLIADVSSVPITSGPHLLRVIDLLHPGGPEVVGGHSRAFPGGMAAAGDLVVRVELNTVRWLQLGPSP